MESFTKIYAKVMPNLRGDYILFSSATGAGQEFLSKRLKINLANISIKVKVYFKRLTHLKFPDLLFKRDNYIGILVGIS
jgi:hypothetical protein